MQGTGEGVVVGDIVVVISPGIPGPGSQAPSPSLSAALVTSKLRGTDLALLLRPALSCEESLVVTTSLSGAASHILNLIIFIIIELGLDLHNHKINLV